MKTDHSYHFRARESQARLITETETEKETERGRERGGREGERENLVRCFDREREREGEQGRGKKGGREGGRENLVTWSSKGKVANQRTKENTSGECQLKKRVFSRQEE